MSRCTAPALLLLVALLTACAQPQQPAPTADRAGADARATELEASGDYAGAADLYLGLEGSPTQQTEYRLLAAEVLLRGNDPERALAVSRPIVADGLTLDQLTRLRLVQAEAALLMGDPETAIRSLPDATPNLDSERLEQVLFMRVAVFEAAGRRTDELLERLSLDRLLTSPDRRRVNQDRIWGLIRRIPQEELLGLFSLDPDLAGWVALIEVASIPVDEELSFDERLSDWRLRFPNHPAMARASEIQASRGTPQMPARAAALLPLSGQYAGAGNEIKAGMDAAARRRTGATTQLEVYDSSVGDPVVLYDQAVRDGAEIVVGPLTKTNVDAVGGVGEHAVPVLALNRSSADTPYGTRFFQFGLAPEDDAETVAAGAMERGWTRALVLYPDTDWGTRVHAAFVTAFTEVGGTVIDARAFDANEVDFSASINHLLHLDQSNERRKALQSQIGRQLEFEPRRRQDVDLIFLAANAAQARQIYPQLRFFQLGELPVVATSHVYGGAPDPIRDQDLNGLYMVALPWLVETGVAETGVAETGVAEIGVAEIGVADVGGSEQRTSRLFALGLDAYRLLAWLPALEAAPGTAIRGATGDLSATADGYVKRRLSWVRFVDGRPQAVERMADPPAPGLD